MTSQAHNNNDVLLFPLQIWKCSDQFIVNKPDTHCFEHLHEENAKLSVNVTSRMLEFSYWPQVFYGFYIGEGRSDRTLIEKDRDGDAFVLVLLNSNLRKQQSRGDTKNNTWKMKVKVFPFELRSFWNIVYFILELLSKLNSFAYNLLDVSI